LGNEEISSTLISIHVLSVMTAIELDHQASFVAAEVGDKRSDRILAAELGTRELARTQPEPQFAFHVGLIAA
jgi:hypothetical protein